VQQGLHCSNDEFVLFYSAISYSSNAILTVNQFSLTPDIEENVMPYPVLEKSVH
jgi:hypothetical protein